LKFKNPCFQKLLSCSGAEHKLGDFFAQHGNDSIAAYISIKNASQELTDKGIVKGIFERSMDVKGTIMTVRGNIIDGIARVNTAFIP